MIKINKNQNLYKNIITNNLKQYQLYHTKGNNNNNSHYNIINSSSSSSISSSGGNRRIYYSTSPLFNNIINSSSSNSNNNNSNYSKRFYTPPLFKNISNIETSSEPIESVVSDKDDLEIKDPAIIFNTVWNKMEQKYGKENMRFPQDFIYVCGAPGAGKGTNTPFICSVRGISSAPVVMSSLLNNAEAKAIKSTGGMVSDSFVFQTILEELRKPEYRAGVVVDGFPRTTIQVELANLLYEKMKELRKVFFNTPIAHSFPRPIFRVTVLFVEEKESIDRQLRRGEITRETNKKLKEQGLPLLEERDTDLSEEAARKRYKIFRDHYSTLQTLKKHFPFSIIDASKSLDKVQQAILKEFKYQSSLELTQETYDLIQRIPLVTELTQHARVDLIQRLDNYQNRHTDLFTSVVHVIEKEFIPTIRRQAIAGSALIRVNNSIFSSPLAIDMALDVLSERGFRATIDIRTTYIPIRIDPTTYELTNLSQTEYQFKVDFEKPVIRDIKFEK